MEKLDVLFLVFGNRLQQDYITDNIKEGLEENEKSYQIVYIKDNLKNFDDVVKNCSWVFTIVYPGFFPNEPTSIENSKLSILEGLNIWDKCVYFDATEWRFDHKPCWGKGPRNEPFNFTYMKEKCKAYFKRECYVQDFKEGYWPFPYSFSAKKYGLFNGITNEFKKVDDIFCSFPQTYTGLRKECIEFCQFLSTYPMMKIKIATGLNRENYIRTVAESMITLDSMGAGQCNTRFFEITPNFTAVFRQKYEVVIPYDFDHSGEKGKEMIVEYANINELKNKILKYLIDPDNLIGMAYRSRAHALEHHTCKARIKYVFDVLEGKLENRENNEAFSENSLLKS